MRRLFTVWLVFNNERRLHSACNLIGRLVNELLGAISTRLSPYLSLLDESESFHVLVARFKRWGDCSAPSVGRSIHIYRQINQLWWSLSLSDDRYLQFGRVIFRWEQQTSCDVLKGFGVIPGMKRNQPELIPSLHFTKSRDVLLRQNLPFSEESSAAEGGGKNLSPSSSGRRGNVGIGDPQYGLLGPSILKCADFGRNSMTWPSIDRDQT